ncbi:MAG: glutathione S-transferase N-terminal domain-containing protein [Rubellimicrobium sp.]|nr:glutathione S-transferase N-terminal domain-containing protein [Rubellimicrobium sp.]
MKLYYMPGACPLAAHIVLEWTGAPHEAVQVARDDLKKPDYLAINPLGVVPSLEADGEVITENSGILTYLAELHPEAGLEGDGSAMSKAHVYSWLGFVNSDMHPAFKPIFGATRYLDDDAMIEKSHADARSRLRGMFEIVDRQLKGRDWIAGTRSLADPYLFVMIRWAKGTAVDLSGLDEVARFYAHMLADAGVQRALKAEGLA